MSEKHAVVLVLGDLGRSPRMQYHAYSLACLNNAENKAHSLKVSLVGYEGERTMNLVSDNIAIDVYRMKLWDFPSLRFISLLHAIAKGIALMFTVFAQLVSLGSYDLIIIQNPPCLPALIAAIVVSWFNNSSIMLDWHNLGFAMFEERLGNKHILVRFSKVLEKYLASHAMYHICVSNAMKEWLSENFDVQSLVLYDRPPAIFMRQPLSAENRHELLFRLNLTDGYLFPHVANCEKNVERTIQTTKYKAKCGTNGGAYGERHIRGDTYSPEGDIDGRAALVMSCTSWTPDEDFTILLDALVLLEQKLKSLHASDVNSGVGSSGGGGVAAEPRSVPSLIGFRRVAVVITGKGPMKQQFEESVKALEQDDTLGVYVAVRTAWLAPQDYPLLLRCADLGVSLHTSTSGLDLPMKVLDMFGSGVPVCAVHFPTLHELVQHDVNGLVFHNAEELAGQVTRLLLEPVGDAVETESDNDVLPELNALKKGASNVACWEDNWNEVMGERFISQLAGAKASRM